MLQDSPRLHTGKKLGRYELLAPAGGAGAVWVARLRGARGFHKLFAVKALPADLGSAAEREFLLQAGLAALIQHSNVVQILELGEQEGRLFLVMEWVDGEPLRRVYECASGGVPVSIAVNWIAQALRGVQAAHELREETAAPSGIVHGALSPSNLLVSYSGTVKLANFGLTSEVDAEEARRAADYRAPGQIGEQAPDHRDDLFALGVMLYELTTGRHPFRGSSAPARERADEAIRPSLLVPNYSRTLEAVVMKAIALEPERRWPSALEMRLALQRGVPEAFELGFDSQLRNFMADTVGEHATRKRELLRGAETIVDAEHPGPAPTSASSLRALSIDTVEKPDSVQAPASLRVSLKPLLARSVPPPHLRRPLALAVIAAAAVSYALISLRSASIPHTAAGAPHSQMVDLTPSRRSPPPVSAVPSASAAPSGAARPRSPANLRLSR